MAISRTKCLKIFNVNDTSLTVSLGQSKKDSSLYYFTLDELGDNDWKANSITIPPHQYAYCRGTAAPSTAASEANTFQFSAAGKIILNGSLTSLFDNGMGGSDVALTAGCFKQLFNNTGTQMEICVRNGLLPSLTVPDGAYEEMFKGQTIKNLPRKFIKGTTIGENSCKGMFKNVSGLTCVPDIFPNDYVSFSKNAFEEMFMGCNELEEIFFFAYNDFIKTGGNETIFTNWVSGVPATGTFHCQTGFPGAYGADGIPTGWSIDNKTSHIDTTHCMKLTNVGAGVGHISIIDNDWGDEFYFVKADDPNTLLRKVTNFSPGDVIYCLGTGSPGRNINGKCLFVTEVVSGRIILQLDGSIMSMIDDGAGALDELDEDMSFAWLFDSMRIDSISSTFLSATTLSPHCYNHLFRNTTLASIPENCLPANHMEKFCYNAMFSQTKITEIPVNLFSSVTALSSNCFGAMFADTPITKVPTGLLPFTDGVTGCYGSMFLDCVLLTTVEKDSICLTDCGTDFMTHMFEGCAKLEKLSVNFTTWRNGTYEWVKNVGPKGDFKGPSSLERIYDEHHIPFGWEPPKRGSMIFNRTLKTVIG